MKKAEKWLIILVVFTQEKFSFIFGNLENNEDRINEVINVTKGLLEAWREVHNNETVAQ